MSAAAQSPTIPADCALVAKRPPLTTPRSFADAPAQAGLQGEERDLPYAKFMEANVAPLRAAVEAALAAPVPHDRLTPFARYAEEMTTPGYVAVENGWTLFPDGVMGVAVLTPMPGVRPEMWDWWFAWHSEAAARYKLWHPNAHKVAHWSAPLPDAAARNWRQRYIGRTSLVKEDIGGTALELAIRFADPAEIGVPHGRIDGTTIYARGSGIDNETEEGCLMHQVRATRDGSEMRSRFYFNLRPECLGRPGMPPAEVAVRFRGPAMVRHAGEEMHHLARFLPALFAEFADT